MSTKIGVVLRKVIFAFCVIYGINVLIKNSGICLPINLVTLTVTTILGIPGLLSLFVIFFIIK
jgi:hypothetical protein